MSVASLDLSEQVWAELWVSLASMLRSYTSAHGLNGNRQATVELGEHRILARHAENWIELNREGSHVTWMRENGVGGTLELTASGQLRSTVPDGADAQEIDMAAEQWARELMQ
jgi:hypothetical protein